MTLRATMGVIGGLFLLALTGRALAQAEREMRLLAVDAGSFPTVRVDLEVTDEALSPVTDLRGLTVREAGEVVGDLGIAQVPTGVGLIIVLDANQSLAVVDAGSDASRLAEARQGIVRYAESFMSPGGLDRVAIIVPDAGGDAGAFLIEDAADPGAVVETITAYEPESLPALSPLNAMMELALEAADARQERGQFQAILLLTNGSELDRQLDFLALTDRAEALRLPIFAAILGSRADPDEIANVARLYEPTRGFYVHMPTALDADPVFTAVQAHATRSRVTYRSTARRSGLITVTLSLGEQVVTGSYQLALRPPEIDLDLPAVVERVAPGPDSALFQLEPVSLTVPVAITWPDALPRELASAELLVDGVVIAQVEAPPVQDGRLGLPWNLRQVDAGRYGLVVQIVDEYGLAARSASEEIEVRASWPEPTRAAETATPQATSTPPPPGLVAAVVWREIPPWLRYAVLGGAGLLALALLSLPLRAWRRGRTERDLARAAAAAAAVQVEPEPEPPPAGQAFLEILERGAPQTAAHVVLGDVLTMGRDPVVADLVFTDPSVSRLHARLRLSDGRYWLYDEGSAAGTYLNFKRVGLMPRPVASGDDIHVGQVHLRLRWDPGYHSR